MLYKAIITSSILFSPFSLNIGISEVFKRDKYGYSPSFSKSIRGFGFFPDINIFKSCNCVNCKATSKGRTAPSKNLVPLLQESEYKTLFKAIFDGFDNSYISKLERATVNITIDRLEQIAKILDVDVINLLEH